MKRNYAKFISVTLVLIVMLAAVFLPAQVEEVYASPGEITLDAVFSEASVSGTSWYGAGIVSSGDWSNDSYRTGIDFDTTSIPNTANITKVELGLTITEEAGTVPNDIAKMTATANSYYIADNYSGHHSDVDGNEYLSNSSVWVGTSTQTFVELLPAARTDLQSQLGDNWFSVGYTQTVDGTANDDYRDGNDYQDTPPPQLIVTYTLPPAAPIVTNSTGASDVSYNSARLNGELTQGSPDPTVHIYWGDEDGETTPGSWDNDENLGTKPVGVFYRDISGLTAEKTYYYRCYATNSEGSDWADSTANFTTTSPSPYLLIVQGAPEKGTSVWWEWIVVNPTDSSKTVTEVRVKEPGVDWNWAINVQGYPASNWADGGADGLYWSGSEAISAHSAKVFRVRATQGNINELADHTLTWSAAVTGVSVSDVTSTCVGIDKGSAGGMFYNKPGDTTEQSAGVHADGLYTYLYEDSSNNPLEAGTQYTFYVNVHEWAGKPIASGGTLTITVPNEFTSVALVEYTDFSDAGVSGGGASDWTITGTNDSAISNSVDHLSFQATTPAGYGVNTNWEFDTRFTGTGDKGETVRYIVEANVLVQAVTWESYNDAAHQNVWGGVGTEYDSTYDMVYMYGDGFELSQLYHIGFYDPSASPNKVATDSSNSTAIGNLSAQYLLTTDPSAEAGTWHAVVYKDPLSPPTDYTADDPNSVVEDDFEVTPEAIPEFPTVISAIAVAALCFGAYYWMRKRRLAYAKA